MNTQNYLEDTLLKLRNINSAKLEYQTGYEIKKIPTLRKGFIETSPRCCL